VYTVVILQLVDFLIFLNAVTQGPICKLTLTDTDKLSETSIVCLLTTRLLVHYMCTVRVRRITCYVDTFDAA